MDWCSTDLPQFLAMFAAGLAALFHVATGHH